MLVLHSVWFYFMALQPIVLSYLNTNVMKRLFNYFLLFSFVLYMGACKKTGTNIPVGLASLTTAGISAIVKDSAKSGGTITADGGAAVTARGVCWSTSVNPTTSNSKTTDGTGTGTFTSSLTGLTAATTYYVRAYATNSVGTAYGTQVSFISAAISTVLATLATSVVSAITTTTASSGGNVTSDGGAIVTARGVCWSTSSNPTISDSKTSDGTGSGSFTSLITGLTANTTYNVRAYATNSAGTAYGNSISFTTKTSLPISPWQMRSSGVSISQRGIIEMFAPDSINCYGVMYDAGNYFGDLLHDITITHDGGSTWHSQTIAGLANDFLVDVSATSAGVVHVIGVNSAGAGGNVFRSTDGGMTWQAEAVNAFTDLTASFPDNIKFFDPQDGVIFGDPEGGYFEIYTTSDGGNSWSRVLSNEIPASLPNEEGLTYVADTYLNTMWAITVTKDNLGNFTSARLLQSDDKGLTWYVRNPSLSFSAGTDGDIKFRNASVGLYKNGGILYRTTDGGTTWNVVNYSGTWFSYDFDNVPGKDGWWISTGGDANFPTNSLKGLGSSISYDDGNTWVTLDTAIDHTHVFMTSATHGYSGGITTGNGNDGVFVYH
jgi:hypothetical protein